MSVDELAAYLGVPKKTVYGCWRQWGLRGYRVGRVPAVPRAARGGVAPEPGDPTIMASIIKRCDCPGWDDCPHPWVVRYRTHGGRTSKQREQSFGDDLKEAENFLLKVEHDKKAYVFIDGNLQPVMARLAAAKASDGLTLDGAGAVAWARNQLVHPKPGTQQVNQYPGLLAEVWPLLRHYLGLLILHSSTTTRAEPSCA
jgi:excisionase family DNA binding protein